MTTAEGLERLLGFLAIVAVRLIQLRTLARSNPALPAQPYVPPLWLTVLATKLSLPRPLSTLGEFWFALAGFGEFIGRKNDGKPSWQTL